VRCAPTLTLTVGVGLPVQYPLPARCGLVWFPSARLPSPTHSGRRAATTRPRAGEVAAALRSRSSTRPHWSHRNVRRQAQFGFHHATGRTGLGGRVPAVRDVHGAAGPAFCTRSGVRSSPQPTPAMWRARRRLRSMPATSVLDHYRAVVRESGGELCNPSRGRVTAVQAAMRPGSCATAARHLSRAVSGPTRRELGAAGDATP